MCWGVSPSFTGATAPTKFTLIVRIGFDLGLSLRRPPSEAMATVRSLQFDQGVPQFSCEPELFDEYLDRVETLVHWLV